MKTFVLHDVDEIQENTSLTFMCKENNNLADIILRDNYSNELISSTFW